MCTVTVSVMYGAGLSACATVVSIVKPVKEGRGGHAQPRDGSQQAGGVMVLRRAAARAFNTWHVRARASDMLTVLILINYNCKHMPVATRRNHGAGYPGYQICLGCGAGVLQPSLQLQPV